MSALLLLFIISKSQRWSTMGKWTAHWERSG